MRKLPSYLICILILFIFSACSSKNTNINQFTLLHKAVEKGNLEMVEFLVSEGADIEAKTHYGDTPLILASFRGHLNIVNYLISKKANLDVESKSGVTPLITAVVSDRLDIVKALVDAGADILYITNKGETALNYAKQFNKVTIHNYLEPFIEKKNDEKTKEQIMQKEIEEIKIISGYLAQNNFQALKKYIGKNPHTIYYIKDKRKRLMLIGPMELKIGDIINLLKDGRDEGIIISFINRLQKPYKEFEEDEIDILINDMGLSKDIISAMISTTKRSSK